MTLLAALAPLSILQSEMPRPVAMPLSLAACAWGLWSARREGRRPVRLFEFGPGLDGARLDGRALGMVAIRWRGRLAFLHWRDAQGQGGRLAWWPDTLPPAKRRQLRLAAGMAP